MEIGMTVLGSGSAGNATFVSAGDFGILIDAGLGPRQVGSRLKESGHGWDDVHAVLLTHVHSDHWKDPTILQCVRRSIPLYVHREHVTPLRTWSQQFPALESSRLVRIYDSHARNGFAAAPGLTFVPFRVSHDGGATFGFRIERAASLFHSAWTMAYAADLGTWRDDQLPHFCDVDLLALEFNHDVGLQKASGRPESLIARVLGDEGHLSNEQAAALLERVIAGSSAGRLRNVVQLHLSQLCNRPHLAQQAARRALQSLGCTARLQTAEQDRPLAVRVTPRAAPAAQVPV